MKSRNTDPDQHWNLYMVQQTTLEQVLLQVVKEQTILHQVKTEREVAGEEEFACLDLQVGKHAASANK